MVHWGWMIISFIAGIAGGICACIGTVSWAINKVAAEEERYYSDY